MTNTNIHNLNMLEKFKTAVYNNNYIKTLDAISENAWGGHSSKPIDTVMLKGNSQYFIGSRLCVYAISSSAPTHCRGTKSETQRLEIRLHQQGIISDHYCMKQI